MESKFCFFESPASQRLCGNFSDLRQAHTRIYMHMCAQHRQGTHTQINEVHTSHWAPSLLDPQLPTKQDNWEVKCFQCDRMQPVAETGSRPCYLDQSSDSSLLPSSYLKRWFNCHKLWWLWPLTVTQRYMHTQYTDTPMHAHWSPFPILLLLYFLAHYSDAPLHPCDYSRKWTSF